MGMTSVLLLTNEESLMDVFVMLTVLVFIVVQLSVDVSAASTVDGEALKELIMGLTVTLAVSVGEVEPSVQVAVSV